LALTDQDHVDLPGSGADQPVSLLQALLDGQVDHVLLTVDGHIQRVRKAVNADTPLTDRLELTAGASLLAFVPQELIITDNPDVDSHPAIVINDRDLAVLQERWLNPPRAEGSKGKGQGQADTSKVLGLGYKDGKLVGVISSLGITYAEPDLTPVEFPPRIPTHPPVYEGPYVELIGPSEGIAFPPGETVRLSGHNFARDALVEIILDDEVIASDIAPDKDGVFDTFVTLDNLSTGQYLLVVRQPATQLEDVQYLYVRHTDKEVPL
jgi:hypothetical protein